MSVTNEEPAPAPERRLTVVSGKQRQRPRFSRTFLLRGSAVARPLINHVILDAQILGWENVPATGPLIVAGNHSSWLDGPLVVIEAPRTVRCLVKKEAFVGPLDPFLHFIGQIPVDRGRPDRAALNEAMAELGRGGAVGVFPEGTRGSGEFASVQNGIAYLAVRAQCPVLPVACLGTAAALPKGARFPRRRPVSIVYGEPFDVPLPANPRSRRALLEVAEFIRLRLVEHLTTSRTRYG